MNKNIISDDDLEWAKMLPLHIFLSAFFFVVYFLPTIYLHLRGLYVAGYKVPPWWLLTWGYSFGLGLQVFTPKIYLAYRRVKKSLAFNNK